MSGIVGWIDFSRDLSVAQPILRSLAGTLAQRGPDGETVWVSQRAAIGYRALDTQGAAKPFVSVAGGEPVVTSVTGIPGNLAELRAKLAAEGRAVDPAASVAEVVNRAYLQWRGEFVPWLTGSFAIAIWDGRTEEVFFARDRLGGSPLFYTQTPTGIVFASERKTLLAHPEVKAELDAAGLREVISHALMPGPLFAGFNAIQPSEIARFSRQGWSRQTYWKLETKPHTDDLDTTIAKIRGMLEDSVAQALPADPSVLFATLSGGMDSSAVAGLAAAELRKRDQGKLRTYTVDFVNSAFESDVMRDTKDAPFAEIVANHIDADYNLISINATDLLDPVVRQGMLRAKDYPTRIYDMEASQHLFIQHLAAKGGKVVFGGGAGDQIFRGARWSNDKGLIASGTFPWIAMAQRFGATNGFGTGLLNQDTLAALDFPTYYADLYADSIAQVEYLPEENEWDRQVRRVAYLVLMLFRLDAGVFSSAGLHSSSPLNYFPLIEYAYNIPNEMHAHGGIEKGLLRAAVADLLPEQVLQRKQSATPVSKDPNYAARLQEEFKATLADPHSRVHSLIDMDKANELASNGARMAEDRLARADVELTLQLDTWLDLYKVRLTL
ncbi:asparagine synthetase B family protein [Actinokineospora sp. HUAS TT18]|uniref:asparagine synthetase B family protein n=1 Tax=Actinokineospora sp. HUAS TT18 TaxID=3447451 RepID=UPI003F522F93